MDGITRIKTNDVMSTIHRKNFAEQWSSFEFCACGGYDKNSRSRVDPVLKLYHNCPMMLTQNKDVAGGEANGSRVFVKEIRVKPGEKAFPLKLRNGTEILGLFASQVSSIVVQHECKTISPSRFEVVSENITFVAKMHDKSICLDKEATGMFVRMRGTQFPLISNSCTTGHKLQGCTVDNILVNSWCYGCNWVYVVLSRVKTLEGLYLRKQLSHDLLKYAQNHDMKQMLKLFERTILVETISEEEYEAMESRIDETQENMDLSDTET